jgi:large subunit ribosomal protein L11
MNKKIKTIVKLVLNAGKASPAPPIGPALGQFGINLLAFCKEYNERTKDKLGLVIPVKITIFEDNSYSFILKTSPVSFLLLNELNLKKGSSKPSKETIGTIPLNIITKIALIKLKELNTTDINKAIKIISGTAKSMGISIKE